MYNYEQFRNYNRISRKSTKNLITVTTTRFINTINIRDVEIYISKRFKNTHKQSNCPIFNLISFNSHVAP